MTHRQREAERRAQTFRFHFARMWAGRHQGDEAARARRRRCLADNTRGQRSARAYATAA